MAGLSTLPDDDLKGNEADSRDLAQQQADNLYKSAPSSEADADAAELARMEKGEAAGEGDRSLADATPEERREALAQQEAASAEPASLYKKSGEGSPDGEGFGSRLLMAGKRYGPSGGILGLVVGMFGFTSIVLVPGSLLVSIEKAITNDSSDMTRTNVSFRRAYIGKLFCNSSCKGSESDTTKNNSGNNENVEDKLNSMSDEQKAQWEKEGFQVDRDETGKIKDMTFPDGKDVTSTDTFTAHAENTPEGREAVSNVLDSRSAWFENDDFKALLDRFDIKKSKTLEASQSEDPNERKKAIDKSFNDETGLKVEPNGSTEGAKALQDETIGDDNASKIKGPIDAVSDKVGKGAAWALPVSAACAAYNVAKVTNATIKAQWMYELIKFAYPFVQAASQIEDQGAIDPSVVENLANRLTWYNTDKTAPDYDKTATDSQGLQMAIYGDTTGLTEFSKHFTTWAWEVGVKNTATTYLHAIQTIAGSKENVKTICNAAKYLQTAALLGCLNPVGFFVCAAGAVIIPAAEEKLIPLIVKELAKPALAYLATYNLSSNLQGEPAGNAIAAGIGQLLQGQTLGSGLTPAGSVSDVKNFITMTNSTNYTYTTQLALDEAKKNQWDVTNQYSFVGQLASMINPYISHDGTLFSRLTNLGSVINQSFASMPGVTANALFSQPSNMTLQEVPSVDPTAARINSCQDPDIQAVGGVCDWSGRIVGISSSYVLNGLNDIATGGGSSNDVFAKSIQYLLTEKWKDSNNQDQIGVINPDGSTKSGSPFDKYVTYCITRKGVDNKGLMPIGSSTMPITDPDYDWSDGSKCIPQNDHGAVGNVDQLNNYSIYYNWCYIQYSTANNVANCTSSAPTTTQQGNGNACSLLNNPHIHYSNPATQADVQKLCNGQTVESYCPGKNITLNQYLINALVSNSSKYDIYINNFGFKDDRFNNDCAQSYQHWKGNAVDIASIAPVGGTQSLSNNNGAWGSLNYSSAAQQQLASQYASDFVATLPANRGGVGQKDCGVHPTYPSSATGATGYMSFSDSCDHLHIDVRDRTNINGI